MRSSRRFKYPASRRPSPRSWSASWRSPATEHRRRSSTTLLGKGNQADMSTLEIKDLHVSIETEQGTKEILKGVSMTISSGEIHAVMGPNGSGKSTLASTIAGHPRYEVTSGSITLDGKDVLEMDPDERAQAGMFLAMQYPVEVPGVTMTNFLRTAKTAID